jgi:hypothetical protein
MIGWIKDTNGITCLEIDRRIYTLLCCVVYGVTAILVGYLTYLFSVKNQLEEMGASLKKDITEIQTSNLYLKDKITSGSINLGQKSIAGGGANVNWPEAPNKGLSIVYGNYILDNFPVKALSSPVDLLDYLGLGIVILAAVYVVKSFSLRHLKR